MNFQAAKNSDTLKNPKTFLNCKHSLCFEFFIIVACYVYVLGIDGFGGAYLRNFSDQLPALQSFFDYGAYTTRSRNLAPTVS